MQEWFDMRALKRSFSHAWRGLRLAFKAERSFRIQIAAGLLVIGFALMLPLQTWQRIVLLIVTVFVLVLELVNSAVERLVDLVRPRLDEQARDVKDLMAGAVLFVSLAAAVIGFAILGPVLFSSVVRL